MGNLSQYFCEKNSLEKELSTFRNSNNSELINSKKEEIQIITRNAYLYGAGITVIAFTILFNHAWTFLFAEMLGMKHRILLMAVIYEKANNTFILVTYVAICYYVCE